MPTTSSVRAPTSRTYARPACSSAIRSTAESCAALCGVHARRFVGACHCPLPPYALCARRARSWPSPPMTIPAIHRSQPTTTRGVSSGWLSDAIPAPTKRSPPTTKSATSHRRPNLRDDESTSVAEPSSLTRYRSRFPFLSATTYVVPSDVVRQSTCPSNSLASRAGVVAAAADPDFGEL